MNKDDEDKIVKVNQFEAMTARLLADMPESTGEAKEALVEEGQLPLWPEPVRGVPNALIRSALFAAVQGANRPYLANQAVASVQGLEIRYRGYQFNQTDLDVWNELVHLCKVQAMGTRCSFTTYGLLKALRRHRGKSEREWLVDTIDRLAAGLIKIKIDNHGVYGGSLVESFIQDTAEQRHVLRLNPELIGLFDAGWTAVDRAERDALTRKPLAQWLHLWCANHASPYPMRVETYRKLSGGGTKHLWKFRQSLKSALAEVQKVGAIASWRLDETDLVHIENKPSLAQARHLRSTRKLPRPE